MIARLSPMQVRSLPLQLNIRISFEKIRQQPVSQHVGTAGASDYLAPKSVDMTCPMVALVSDAAHRAADNPLRGLGLTGRSSEGSVA